MILESLEPGYEFAAEEIVVDLSAVDVVVRHLRSLHPSVAVTQVIEDRRLDLALLRLDGVAGHPVPEQPREEFGCGERADGLAPVVTPGSAAPPPSALDTVLRALRESIAGRYGGWLPDIGKNRTMRGIVGLPQSQSLAFGAPVPIARPASWPTTPVSSPVGAGVRVAVLDTQVSAHPVLDGHVVTDPSTVLRFGEGALSAVDGHGTFVAGLIVRQAPGAQIIAEAVLDKDGHAKVWETAVAIAGLAYAGVDVVNLSLGCRTLDGKPPLVLRRAVDLLRDRTLVVAAAGNHWRTPYRCRPTWPAALSAVVAVGSVRPAGDSLDEAVDFSPRLPWVDVLAPGIDVESTYVKGQIGTDTSAEEFARWSGTSFAAAIVTGAVAAGTVPGRITARQALADLLDRGDVVTRYAGHDD